MSEELKTLNDFDWTKVTGSKKVIPNIIKKELRAEAVKRWKYYQNKKKNAINYESELYYQGRMDEIEENFNLTEKDLK